MFIAYYRYLDVEDNSGVSAPYLSAQPLNSFVKIFVAMAQLWRNLDSSWTIVNAAASTSIHSLRAACLGNGLSPCDPFGLCG